MPPHLPGCPPHLPGWLWQPAGDRRLVATTMRPPPAYPHPICRKCAGMGPTGRWGWGAERTEWCGRGGGPPLVREGSGVWGWCGVRSARGGGRRRLGRGRLGGGRRRWLGRVGRRWLGRVGRRWLGRVGRSGRGRVGRCRLGGGGGRGGVGGGGGGGGGGGTRAACSTSMMASLRSLAS